MQDAIARLEDLPDGLLFELDLPLLLEAGDRSSAGGVDPAIA